MRIHRRHGWAGLSVLLLTLGAHLPASRAASSGETPWLGVYTQSLSAELREGMNLDGDGVLVNRVIADSPADRAGIRKGDVMVRVNSRLIDSPEELARVVRMGRVGSSVAIMIMRDGVRKTFTVELAARPDQDTETNADGDRRVIKRRFVTEPEAEQENPDANADGDRRVIKKRVVTEPDVEVDPDIGGALDHLRDLDIPGVEGMTMFRSLGRGRLGVRIESLNPELGDYFGVKDGKGVLIVEVLKDTPAEAAGIKAGDVITRVGSRDVDDADDLVRAIGAQDEGSVSISLVRRGTPRTVQATLEATPETPRVMRLRRGDGNFRWFQDGTERRGTARESDNVRKELEELRKELLELRRDLEGLKKQ